ncbi:MAG: sugar phosphate isomerase/epimerase family protein [Chitinophagaceae bacterium]
MLQPSFSASLENFGLQLYTLRDDLPRQPKEILRQVAGFGYKQLEGYEGPQGLWWGMTPKDFGSYLKNLGLTMISSHCDVKTDLTRKAGEAASIGLSYLISPGVGRQPSLEAYKHIAGQFNEYGAICKKQGIRFAYHNHDYPFTLQEGQFPQDIFMNYTDPELVDFEMDIYWVVTPGQDAEQWLRKYPNRFRLCHVKDREKGAPLHEADASVDLGTGSIDFSQILSTAKAQGMRYYIVEQERYVLSTPLKSAEADAAFMKQLRLQ